MRLSCIQGVPVLKTDETIDYIGVSVSSVIFLLVIYFPFFESPNVIVYKRDEYSVRKVPNLRRDEVPEE